MGSSKASSSRAAKLKRNGIAEHDSYFSKQVLDLLKGPSYEGLKFVIVAGEKLLLYAYSQLCPMPLLGEDGTGFVH